MKLCIALIPEAKWLGYVVDVFAFRISTAEAGLVLIHFAHSSHRHLRVQTLNEHSI